MRVEVPYVYQAWLATSPDTEGHRALVLSRTTLDLREVAAEAMSEAMTYRTEGGALRTLRTLDGAFYELAHDPAVEVRARDPRAVEADYGRRRGFLGTPDRRGRGTAEETLRRFSLHVEETDRDAVLAAVAARAGEHVVCGGRAWLRVPEPVLVVQRYDADENPNVYRHLKAVGAPGKRGVFVSIRCFDLAQEGDGVAGIAPKDVFNIRDLERAKRHAADLADLFDVPSHVAVEAETRRLLEPFAFRHDRRRALLNEELADLCERHVDRFARDHIMEARAEAVHSWVELRDALRAATHRPPRLREPLTAFEMDPAPLQIAAARLADFARSAVHHLEPAELSTIAAVTGRWADHGTETAPEAAAEDAPAPRP